MAINNSLQDSCNSFLDLADVIVAQTYLYGPTEDVFVTVILPAVLTICIVGNGAFIYTVFKVRSMRTVTNSYLSHVAAADILFVTFSVTGVVSAFFKSPVRNDVLFRSFVGCMLAFYSIMTTYFASLFLITFVTVERYYAICMPLKHRLVASKSRTKKIIAAAWTLGLFFGAWVTPRYSSLVSHCVKWPDNEQFKNLPEVIHFCVEVHPNVYLLSELTQTVPFFVIMIVNIFMYSGIIFTLNRRNVTTTGDDALAVANQHQNQRIRNQVARLLIINGSLFFLLQAPFRVASIHNMMLHQGRPGLFTSTQYGAMLVIGRCLTFINSCVNPFVYFITSSIYRNAFRTAMKCRVTTESSIRASTVTDKTISDIVRQ